MKFRGENPLRGRFGYHEVRVEDGGQLETVERGQFLLGQQYYQDEAVSLIAESSETGGT